MTDFEILIPDSADEFDTFVEHFDQQIKNSNLKRAAKIAQTEWDLSGGILSKGNVNIHRSANNIIVHVKSKIDVLVIIIVIVLFLLMGLITVLLGIIILAIALNNESKIGTEVRRATESAKTKILMKASYRIETGLDMGKKKITECPSCGKPLSKEGGFCPYCGSKLEKCTVCNLIIGKDDEITKCPYCSGIAHRDHILEYIKIKGECPRCGKELKKYELV